MEDDMKVVSIGFSILSDSSSFCAVHGKITSPIIPQIGDRITFPFINGFSDLFDGDDYIKYVTSLFLVESRIIQANNGDDSLTIAVNDLKVSSSEEAKNVSKYFEVAYKFHVDFEEV